MANYRPKSLNELNNLYDKSLEAENQIKKNSSKLEDKPAQSATAFLPDEEALPMKKTPQQIASDEIADQIGSFAKSFGSTDAGKKTLAIATVQSKPRPKKKPEADDGEQKKAAPKESKPKLIRDPARTTLFENYKKVMDDEDDYNFGEPEKTKRIRRGRKNKVNEENEVLQETEGSKDEIESRAEEAVESVFEDVAVDVKKTKKKNNEEKKTPFKQVSYEDYLATRVEKKEEVEPAEEKTTSPVVQIVLMVALLCVLISSIGIGCIKAFSGVNSDKVVLGNSYVYTAKRSYDDLGIKKGCLIITDNRYPVEGDIVAYKRATGNYAFAAYWSTINEDSIIAVESAQQIPVFAADLRGVVKTTVPVVGTILAGICSYFLPIIGLMLLLAALLVLLIYFVSKNTELPEEYEEEDDEYDSDSEQQSFSDESYDAAYDDSVDAYDEAESEALYEDDEPAESAEADGADDSEYDLESLFNME